MILRRENTPNKWVGGNRMEVILIHWWGDPAQNPTLEGVVNHLKNPAPGGDPKKAVSAHYVVSDETTVQLAEETDRPWHALQANDFAIGIELNPNTPGNTYKTVGELVREIRKRRGNLPLRPHSYYVKTQCPGTIDLARIDKEAKGGDVKDFGDGDAVNVSKATGVPLELVKSKKDWNDVAYSILIPHAVENPNVNEGDVVNAFRALLGREPTKEEKNYIKKPKAWNRQGDYKGYFYEMLAHPDLKGAKKYQMLVDEIGVLKAKVRELEATKPDPDAAALKQLIIKITKE